MTMKGLQRAPLYKQLALKLEQDVVSSLQVGELLPTEAELVSRYHVSITTVRKAVDILERRNLVLRRQGSGTFVLDRKLPERDVALLLEFDVSNPHVSPFYLRFLQETRLALFKLGISSRPYLGHVGWGLEFDELTCAEIARDMSLNRLNGIVSIGAHPHPSWISEFRRHAVPTVGGNELMDNCVEVDRAKVAAQILGRFQQAGRKRLLILDWERALSEIWITEATAAAYGLTLTRVEIPLTPGSEATQQAWDDLQSVLEKGSAASDCLLVADDMLFANCQKVLLSLPTRHFSHQDLVVFGSDAVDLHALVPLVRCYYPVRQRAKLVAEVMRLRLNGDEAPAFTEVQFSFSSTSSFASPQVSAAIAQEV